METNEDNIKQLKNNVKKIELRVDDLTVEVYELEQELKKKWGNKK